MSEGKKTRKKKPASERWKKYKISGDKVERLARFCPRCGPGIFLMNAKNRLYCGRCHYTEFISEKK
jgi:small subunit ribosomal protein S27Ae